MKNLTNKLHTLTTNKETIHTLAAANTGLIRDIFPLLLKKIKIMRDLPKHKTTKKATLAKELKADLKSEEPIVNVALNLIILGLTLDTTMSLNNIKQIITMFNKEELTKNQINKATKEELIAIIKDANKVKGLAAAKAKIAKDRKEHKAANNKDTKKAA